MNHHKVEKSEVEPSEARDYLYEELAHVVMEAEQSPNLQSLLVESQECQWNIDPDQTPDKEAIVYTPVRIQN